MKPPKSPPATAIASRQGMTWRAIAAHNGLPAAVYPLDDLREHDPDNAACWCGPPSDDGVLVHHAMDRREEFEEGRRAS